MAGATDLHRRLLALLKDVDWDELYAVCDEIERRPDGDIYVPDLLMILEAHPDFDFGTVGPITHTAETFRGRGYEQDLEESVRRTPTYSTLFAVKRLVNGTEGEERDGWIALLREIASDETRDTYSRDLARDLID